MISALVFLGIGAFIGGFVGNAFGAWAARKKAQWDLVKRMWR